MSMVTSAARPSAPSAAAANDVAMLKKMTVPPSAVARIAPCSQPGTSTQTTVTSAGPAERADDGVGERDRVAGVGQRDVVGDAGRSQPLLLGHGGHDADASGRRRAGRRRATATRTCRPRRSRPRCLAAGDARRWTTRCGQRRRAADVEHGQGQLGVEVVREHGRDRAGEQDGVAARRHLLRCGRPSRPVRR